MDKIRIARIAQTVPVLDGELKLDTNLEQLLDNIIGVTFKKSLNKGQNVEESLVDNRKTIEELKLLRNVLDQNHGSVLEHVYVTYAVINASRSYLAQQTRHRMFNYTSSSQHYIDHTEMSDAEIPVELLKVDNPEVIDFYLGAYKDVKEAYNTLISKYGIDHSVARQLLPNAQRNLLIVTANIRSWINFMNQRNTSEIQYIAYLIREDLKKLVPTCAEYMVPDCISLGHCTQKAMSCGHVWSEEYMQELYGSLLPNSDIEGEKRLSKELKYGIYD